MIRSATDPSWIGVALASLDTLLIDHAHCEKKAAATALSLVSSYPERDLLVRRLSALAIEELRHFRSVCDRLHARGRSLTPDRGDPYARELRRTLRGGEERLLDRLLVAGLIEARSCERLGLLAANLEDPDLREFYAALARAESGHSTLFDELARAFFPAETVDRRIDELARAEAAIVAALPVEPRIH